MSGRPCGEAQTRTCKRLARRAGGGRRPGGGGRAAARLGPQPPDFRRADQPMVPLADTSPDAERAQTAPRRFRQPAFAHCSFGWALGLQLWAPSKSYIDVLDSSSTPYQKVAAQFDMLIGMSRDAFVSLQRPRRSVSCTSRASSETEESTTCRDTISSACTVQHSPRTRERGAASGHCPGHMRQVHVGR